MKLPVPSLLTLTALLVAGCATAERGPDGQPRLERLPAGALAQIPAAGARTLTAEDIVRLVAEQRTPPEVIVQSYRASGSRLNLTEPQKADLRSRGVPQSIIDQIANADADAARADRDDARVRTEAAEARRREGTASYLYGGYGAYWRRGYGWPAAPYYGRLYWGPW